MKTYISRPRVCKMLREKIPELTNEAARAIVRRELNGPRAGRYKIKVFGESVFFETESAKKLIEGREE